MLRLQALRASASRMAGSDRLHHVLALGEGCARVRTSPQSAAALPRIAARGTASPALLPGSNENAAVSFTWAVCAAL